MLGARDVPDEKLDKSLIKLLTNKDEELQHLAVRLLAERRVKSALPELEQLAHKAKDSATVTATLRAITELRKFDKAWHAELVQWASSPTVETRNGALALLAELGDKTFEPTLIAALQHPHWSTRLAAAKGLEQLRTRGAVGALIARLPAESGHLQHELGDMLWRLTGQGFGENARVWADWWAEHGATFELVGAAQLELLLEDAAERELKRVTTASSFFGIRVESERVIFILDVSGSMDEPTRGKYVGEVGDLRIEVAKRELTRCLKGLAADSQFNVITFSGNVRPWSDTIQDWAPDTLDDASKFVNKLRAGGGSDLFAALEAAFEDEEVDTIYVLSDGEPSMGVVIEPVSIRARVEKWNRDRGVTIHAIAVGGSFRILEWLAEDSGGTHVRIP